MCGWRIYFFDAGRFKSFWIISHIYMLKLIYEFKNIRSKVGDDYPLLFRFGHDEKVNGGRTLEEAARALGKEVYVIGDASQPGPANKATEAALDAVLKLG